jgi:hypothetical protein
MFSSSDDVSVAIDCLVFRIVPLVCHLKDGIRIAHVDHATIVAIEQLAKPLIHLHLLLT